MGSKIILTNLCDWESFQGKRNFKVKLLVINILLRQKKKEEEWHIKLNVTEYK